MRSASERGQHIGSRYVRFKRAAARRSEATTSSEALTRIQEILAKQRENEAVLRARVCHAALFGSRARGDARPDSDILIMVEFDPAAHVTVFNCAGVKEYIADLFDGPVDVVSREGLKPYVRPAVITDAIYAFQQRDCCAGDLAHPLPPPLAGEGGGALSFTAGFDGEAFVADPRTVYTATRCLQIVSEAFRRK